AVGRLDPYSADDALPAVPLVPVNGYGLAVHQVGEVLLGACSEWLLSLGRVDTAQADLLNLAALWIEAGDGVAVRYASDSAFELRGEGRGGDQQKGEGDAIHGASVRWERVSGCRSVPPYCSL